ncbi:hypothetical protein CBR_g1204 [Chara braunii]|uniref:Protein kinase domain-containing protein n=1 Tax=Chara braunii TaxID=69332 RepID=A0A388KDQ9_CHABU|nr:hypothetical protein CBR_g1204 [Chara braunii]|eukprot:GBG68083.1 hypothetical protein CBR_g1204 [Chara braunii]
MGDGNGKREFQLVPKFERKGQDILKGGCTRELQVLLHPHGPWFIFTPDGKSLQVWNYDSGTRVGTWVTPGVDDVLYARMMHVNNWILVKRKKSFCIYENQGNNLRCIKVLTGETGDEVAFGACVHRSLPYLLTCFNQPNFYLWDLLEGGYQDVYRVKFHPTDSEIFASISGDDTIKVWDLPTRSVIKTLMDTGKGYVEGLAFCDRAQKSLVISHRSQGGTVRIWDYRRGVRMARWETHKENVCQALFHPRMPYIFTASANGEIKVWEESSYQQVLSYSYDKLWNMSLCEHSNILALGGKGEFRVLEVVTQKVKKRREGLACAMVGLEKKIEQEMTKVELNCKKVIEELRAEHQRKEMIVAERFVQLETQMKTMVERLEKSKLTIQEVEGKLAQEVSARKMSDECRAHLADRVSQLEFERDTQAEKLKELEKRLDTEFVDACTTDSPLLLREFSGKELRDATCNFDVKCAEGDPKEQIYVGKLGDGTLVTVRRLRDANTNAIIPPAKFKSTVVDRLRLLRHPHLVTLLGVCYEESSLVYEHMACGNLKDWIIACEGKRTRGLLPWYVRFRIMAEIARGLCFLQSDPLASGGGPVIHRAIRPTNILLDNNFVAKIGGIDKALLDSEPDDGLRQGGNKVSELGGNYSDYVAPECWKSGLFNEKTDIYSLGITLLEMLTGNVSTAFEVIDDVIEDNTAFESALDANAGLWDVNLVREVARLGLSSADRNRRKRPSMMTPDIGILPVLEGIARKVELAETGKDT